jgi:hypothetical protein
MVIQLLNPQELEVYYILPALRRELAKAMKTLGRSQKEIAGNLGVTEAAVSQYIHQKRATGVDFTKGIQKDIVDAASQITGRNDFLKVTQQLIRKIRGERFICDVCKSQNKGTPKSCSMCYE